MEIRRTGVDLIQSPQTTETAPEKMAQQTATESNATPLSESTIATRRNDFAMAGMLQQSLLSSQLTATQSPPEAIAPTAEKTPAPDASIATRELKLGDSGNDVSKLQAYLNRWRWKNNLPPIDQSGVFNEDTRQAILQFQKATNLTPTGKAGAAVQEFLTLEENSQFEQLNTDVKDMIRNDFSILQNDPTARQRLTKLATDKTFGHLIPVEAQKSAIHSFMSNTASEEHFKGVQGTIVDVAILEKEQTINHLSPETKQKVIDTLFTKTVTPPGDFWGAENTRQDIIRLAALPEFSGLSPKQQQDLMDGIASSKSSEVPSDFIRVLVAPSFARCSEKVVDRIVFLASNDAKVNNGDQLQEMWQLLREPSFETASEDEQLRMLNRFRQNKGDEY